MQDSCVIVPRRAFAAMWRPRQVQLPQCLWWMGELFHASRIHCRSQPVDARLLAKNQRPRRASRTVALSLTSFAAMRRPEQASSHNVCGRSQDLHASQIHCRSEPDPDARLLDEKPRTAACIQDRCVIVDDHRDGATIRQARSYSGIELRRFFLNRLPAGEADPRFL